MPTETRTDAVAMMAERLEHAVETDGSVDLLENWLQGFDLPPLGVEEEPYVWIMRGLSETVERVRCERALATWLAEWFRRKPDVERRGEYPDQALYNAFFLAAGLASPDEIAEPLFEMYERRQLSGDYLGIDHRGSLRTALSQNQLDARLEPVWRAMATGKETNFLPGNAYDGFEALAMMPDPVKGRGHPALVALGEALTNLIRKLDDQPRLRERRFERLLTRLCGLYPGLERAILGHLAHVAEEEEWPSWAVAAVEEMRARGVMSKEEKGLPFDVGELFKSPIMVMAPFPGMTNEQVEPADEVLLTGLRRELRTASGAKLEILRRGLRSVLEASRQAEEPSTSSRSQFRLRP